MLQEIKSEMLEPVVKIKEIEMTRDGRMTIEETCKFIGISKNTMYDWIQQGKAPPNEKTGRRLYFYYKHVKKWLRKKHELNQKR